MLQTFLGSCIILNAFSVSMLSSRLHNKNINLTGLGTGLKKETFWQVQKKILLQNIFNVSTIFHSLTKTDYVDGTEII